jgi:TolA-binding protein
MSMPRKVCLLLLLTLSRCVSSSAQESKSAFDQAQQLYRDGKTTEALAALQEFEKQYPLSAFVPQAIYLQGWCEADLHKYREAADTFDNLLKSYPTANVIPNVLLKEADCRLELKDYGAALALYNEFQTKYPNNRLQVAALVGEAWTYFEQDQLDIAKSILQKVPPDLTDPSFLRVQILIAEKNYDTAAEVLRRIPSEKSNAGAFYRAGEALFATRQYTNALACYERAQSAPELQPFILFRVANCQQSLRLLQNAVNTYRSFLKNYPENPLAEQAHFALLQSLLEGHEVKAAINEAAVFQKMYPHSPFNADVLFLQSEALFTAGQFQIALDGYRKFAALNKNPELAETTAFHIAACHYGLRDFNQARELLTAFLQKHPNSKFTPEARSQLQAIEARAQAASPLAQLAFGKESLSQNRLDNAEKAFGNVLAVDPRNTDAELGLAKIYLMQGRTDTNTVELLNHVAANSTGQSNGEAAFLLGGYFFQLPGNTKENKSSALAWYLRASMLASGPESEEASFRTGQCHKALGNTEAARSAFQSYLRRFPNGKLADRAKEELASL